MQRETELLFESVVLEDKSVLRLLDADYTFVNERLARHYGIPNVYGTQFRKVTVADDARRGLLGHGSILALTSQNNRTSPVLRGKYVLTNILGTPPPEAAGQRAAARRDAGEGALDARPHGGTSAQSGLRGLPQADGSDRSVAREFRRNRPLAHRRQRCRDRRVCATRGRLDGRRSGGAATGAAAPARDVRAERDRDAAGLRARSSRRVPTTCRTSAPSSRNPARPTIASHPSCSASSRVRRFSGGDQSHDDHEEGHPAPHRASRPWCDRRTAAARQHGAGGHGPGADTGRSDLAVWLRLRAARLDHAGVDAGAGGRQLRVLADPQAARVVPETRHRAVQSLQLRRERSLRELRDVAERDVSVEGQPAEARDDRRSGHRAEDRTRLDVPVDGVRDRGSFEPPGQLRRRFPLLVHEHDQLGLGQPAAADGDQPARRVRADVRRRSRDTGGAADPAREEHEHPRRRRAERARAVRRSWAPGIAAASATTWTTCARSSAAS